MTHRLAIAALGLALTAMPAFAQTATPAPAAAVKLSDILAKIEGEAGFNRFDEIDWDDRDGQWEIEYLGADGRKITVDINGATGEPVTR